MDSSPSPEKNSATPKDNKCPPTSASRRVAIAHFTSGTQDTEEENNARTHAEVTRHQASFYYRPGSADEPGYGPGPRNAGVHLDRAAAVCNSILDHREGLAVFDS